MIFRFPRTVALVVILLVVCLALFLPKNPISLDDGLRHFKIAELYRENWMKGLAGSESALGGRIEGWGDFFFTGYFSERNFDPWYGADLAYIPFTFIPNPVIGLKVATIGFLVIILLSFLLLLRRYKASPELSALLLFLLFLGSYGFTNRMLFGRPFLLTTGVFLLTYLLLLEKRFFLLALLLAFSVLLSHLFIFPVLLCLLGVVWMLSLKRWRDSVLLAGAASGGVIIGFLLHPDPPLYLSYLRDVFLRIPFAKELGIGAEFAGGLSDADILLFLILFLLILVFALCRRRFSLPALLSRRPEISLTLFLMLGFLGAYVLWERAVDFLWPLMLLFALQLLTIDANIEREAFMHLHSSIHPRLPFRWIQGLLLLLFLNSGLIIFQNLKFDRSKSLSFYSAIQSIPAQSRVLNIDWDIFPVLFFLRSDLLYARGMDPTFDWVNDVGATKLFDRVNDRFSFQWSDLPRTIADARMRFNGSNLSFVRLKEKEDLDVSLWLKDLRNHFQADYLLLKKGVHPSLIQKLSEGQHLSLAFESHAIVIFSLR